METTHLANAITPAIQDSYCGPAKCPSEILALIFSYLNYKDLHNVSLVCREFKMISFSKAWLKRLHDATAIVLGDDMREQKKVFPIFPTKSDFFYEELADNFNYLFFRNEDIVWYVNRRWKNNIPRWVFDSVFYVGDPFSREIKSTSKYSLCCEMTKIKDGCLICMDKKNGEININKFKTNEFEKSIADYSIDYEKNAIVRTSNITFEGLLAIGSLFQKSLNIIIDDYINDKIFKMRIVNEKNTICLKNLALFSRDGENRLAVIYRLNDSISLLSIHSFKNEKPLALIQISNDFQFEFNMDIKQEKMSISDPYKKYTQVIDLKTMEIIFTQDGYYPKLHQNKLILINKEDNHIEIHTLSPQQATNTIIIPINPLENIKQFAVSEDLIAIIDKQDIKLFNLNTGKHVTTFSTAKIENPGLPHSIYFEMKGIDSYLCVILDDTRVIYYSPKDFTKPIDVPTLSDQHI